MFELSETTQKLVRYLQAHEKGQLVPYRELTKTAGISISSTSPNLSYARIILLRDHNQVWMAIRPKVGIQRLTDAEMAEHLSIVRISRARKQLKRGGHEGDAVERSELDKEQQARFGVLSIQRQIAFEGLSKAAYRKLERVARGSSNDLPAFNIIEWAFPLMTKEPPQPKK